MRMLNGFGKISFRNFLMLFSLGVMLVLLLLLSSFLFFKVKHFIDDKKQFIINTRLNQISFEISTSFSNVYYTLNNLKTNGQLISDVQKLGDSRTDNLEKYRTTLDLDNLLYNVRQENAYIDSVLVVTPTNQFSADDTYLDFSVNGMRASSKLEKKLSLVLPGEAAESLDFPDLGSSGGGLSKAVNSLNQRLFFAANITDDNGSQLGVILILLNSDYYKNNISYNDNISLMDANRYLIFSGGEMDPVVMDELKNNITREEGSFFLPSHDIEAHYITIPFHQFRLIYVDRVGFYREQVLLMIRLLAVIFMVGVLVTFVSSRIISSKVLLPVYKLIKLFSMYDITEDQHQRYKELLAKKSRFNLRDRFLVYFIVTIFLPFIVYMAIFYWQSSKIVADDLKETHYSLFEKTASQLEHNINQIEVLMSRISLDRAVQADMLAKDPDKLEEKLLDENHLLGLNQQSVRIYDRFGTLMFSNRYKQIGKMEATFYNRMKSSGRLISYNLTKDDLGKTSVVLGMPIMSMDKFPEVIGFITVEMPSEELSNLYAEFKQNGSEAFIVDADRRIVSHPVIGQIGKSMDLSIPEGNLQQAGPFGGQYFVSAKKIGGVPWRFVSSYNYSDVKTQVINLFLSDSYLIFLIFLLMLVFAYFMSQGMLKPLSRLSQGLNEYELGKSDLMILKTASGIDEVDLLGRNFNQMIRRMDDLMQESLMANKERIKLEYEKKEIQMIALQSQINPHFLYNTLENLTYLVEMHEVDKAVGMISSLSRLFRYITNREQIIQMRDEIQYAKTYVGIMSSRYDNFQCIWHTDEDVLECATTKLILQPVIENAIHHGARMTKQQVTIEISCQRQGDVIRVVVKDNALGMKDEDLLEVRKQLDNPEIKKVGIFNVNARIKLNFGEDFGLSIDSKVGEGTVVTLLLPANASR
ncbi:hypothetical protein J23TS9_27370 [Paenibacillus sp. J23TS9]|uniref:sensor histidine kinase n=1 Tax=Paenibacillus sp. J23TS9 TaxID=2807193 RepID=UPI001B07C701|nr:histidine kinase [Paenibacillus sp. J23TS9]GIP27607.1 hypothetical protein J23TS9_27370 [Paenibacillus sp. J23TS9]